MNSTAKQDDDWSLKLVCAADLKEEQIDWVWESRLAKGVVNLIVGDPGSGKSLLTCDLAARVSSGRPFPDQCGLHRPSANVIMLGAEDPMTKVVVPRLIGAGADMSHVHLLAPTIVQSTDERTVDISRDIQCLRKLIAKVGNVGMVVVDPISCFLGTADTHVESITRSILTPLGALAEDLNLCVVGVKHLTKNEDAKAIYRIGGSIGFSGAARSIWLVVERKDIDRRWFIPAKTSYINPRKVGGLEFTIVADQEERPRIQWTGTRVTVSADDVLAEETTRKERRELPVDRARDWLAACLADGPVRVSKIRAEADEKGIAPSTLERAARKLGVKNKRRKRYGKTQVFWVIDRKEVKDEAKN